jgi:hypothetical protein
MTNPTNSGEVDSVNERLAAIQKSLDEYSKWLGIDALLSSGLDINKYISVPHEEIIKWSPEQCTEAAYCLIRQATFIQYQTNRLRSMIIWAEANIEFIIAEKVQQYNQYITAEHKRTLAIKDSSFTMKLQDLLINAKIKLELVLFIPMNLKNQSDYLLHMAQTKRSIS